MKIVYLSNARIPSASANSVQIMKMCAAFASLGHEVHLIAIGGEGAEEDPFGYYGVEPSFRIHRVRWFGRLPGKYFLYAWMAARRAMRLSPDLVYGRYLFGIDLARRMGAVVAYESHSDEFSRGPIHRTMAARLATDPRCRAIVTISDALRLAWEEAFPAAEGKTVTARDGADLPAGAPVRKPESGTPFTAGYVGHLYPGKGVEILAGLAERCPDIHFLVVGGTGRELDFWREQLADLPNAELTGHVPHHRTNHYFERMDVLLAPYARSVTGREGGVGIGRWMSPLKIFEYMAAGRPILAPALPVLGEVLRDGENALLCEPEDLTSWERALRRLQNDPALCEQLAAQARSELVERYTWENRARTLMRILDR